MSLKKEILKKIPEELRHDPHVKALLQHVKDLNLKTKDDLINHLNKEIALLEQFITKHKGPTAVKSIRDKVIKLGVYKKCIDLTQQFLL